MKKLRLSRYMKKRLTLAGAVLGAGLMLHSCGEAEAEPQADPAEVQRFLERMESARASGETAPSKDERKDGSAKSLRNFVEGAATRAPSDSTVNRIEKAVTRRLG